MSELSYYNTFFKTTHPPAVALSEKLAELAPAHMNRVFYCSSGSEANDTVFRMARFYWTRWASRRKRPSSAAGTATTVRRSPVPASAA